MLWHLGFQDVRNIDGSGDRGGDILGLKRNERGQNERWAIQCKWRQNGSRASIDDEAVEQVDEAARVYRCERSLLITNGRIGRLAASRIEQLRRVGVRIDVLDAEKLAGVAQALPRWMPRRYGLRPYQQAAAASLMGDLGDGGRALLVLATGLGKTVVGGEVIERHLRQSRDLQVLVVAHMTDLVAQLEKALWRHLPAEVATHLLDGKNKPVHGAGVTCATVESALRAVREGYSPGLVMIDETHHVAEDGHFAELLDLATSARQFGVTATPWRGDKYDIEQRFGPASFTMGITEGMRQGYLASVNYKLYLDNIDWDVVRHLSEHDYSIKELNRRLFLPDRDAAVAGHLLDAWHRTHRPRAIVFCATIDHAERMVREFRRTLPAWKDAAAIHSGMPRRERDVVLAEFRRGDVPIVCAVDVFNEGVDVPDANIVAFLRVTHSRRIFIQQLGRGLRLKEGKGHVLVLDFVSDIRRVAALLDMRQDLSGPDEELNVDIPARIEFSDAHAQTLMEEWIADAASLETANDDAKLPFPDLGSFVDFPAGGQ
jgi:superfamily II DNA or RNA helicase